MITYRDRKSRENAEGHANAEPHSTIPMRFRIRVGSPKHGQKLSREGERLPSFARALSSCATTNKNPMAQKTFLSRLKLTDFRNYADVSLTLDGRHVVLTGENGAGKTNLLEAVSFLSPGRGLRRAVLTDVSRVGASGGFAIFAAVEGMEGEVAIGTGIETADGESVTRKVRINGTPAKSTEELSDHLSVLWLTPAMDGLFTGPSADRRRFLDRLVLSLDPAHGRRASDFERAMRSRNRLLSEGRFDPAWLSGIETQMAGLGIAMAAARQEMREPDDHLLRAAGFRAEQAQRRIAAMVRRLVRLCFRKFAHDH